MTKRKRYIWEVVVGVPLSDSEIDYRYRTESWTVCKFGFIGYQLLLPFIRVYWWIRTKLGYV